MIKHKVSLGRSAQGENKASDLKNIESYILNSAKHYALRLVNKRIYSFYDLDDLEQEFLALFYYQNKRHKYDPNKSSQKHWVNVIMESIYKNLLKKKIISNKHRIEYSLNNPVYEDSNSYGDNAESEMIEFIEDENADTFESYYKLTQREKLFNIIETLPEDLKEICRLLQTLNVTEISRELNLSRKTIYQKINKIKKIFSDVDVF